MTHFITTAACSGAAEPQHFDGLTLAARHADHYRSCHCLAYSAECCQPSCECHDLARSDGSGGTK